MIQRLFLYRVYMLCYKTAVDMGVKNPSDIFPYPADPVPAFGYVTTELAKMAIYIIVLGGAVKPCFPHLVFFLPACGMKIFYGSLTFIVPLPYYPCYFCVIAPFIFDMPF